MTMTMPLVSKRVRASKLSRYSSHWERIEMRKVQDPEESVNNPTKVASIYG
jgi:hypothetical protein